MRRAVIDIGTNTVKLLVADVEDGTVTPIIHLDETTRLGEGLMAQAATGHSTGPSRTRDSCPDQIAGARFDWPRSSWSREKSRETVAPRLSPAAIVRTVAAIARYAAEAHRRGARDVIALTTSATRSAGNAGEFLEAVRRQCGLEVQVLSGDREAELIFRGVASDPLYVGQRLLVMDVGGGSAEWVLGRAGASERLCSLPLGAVRLLERFGDNDFVALAAHLRAALAGSLAAFRAGPWRMIGTGGAAVTLANIVGQASRLSGLEKMDKRDAYPTETLDKWDAYPTGIDHAHLTLEALRALVTQLNALPLADRRRVPGLPPERADIIVPGAAVFLFAMERLGASDLSVSVRSLRFGALLE